MGDVPVTQVQMTLKEAHGLGCCRKCGRDFIGSMPNDAMCTRCSMDKWERAHKAAMAPVERGKK